MLTLISILMLHRLGPPRKSMAESRSVSERPERLLIADEHMLCAEGLRKLLEPEFGLIDVVSTAACLLEFADREAPDLVICSTTLPDIDGFEVTRRFKQRHPETRVLILSAYSEPVWVRKAFDAGANGFLPKNSVLAELQLAVREVLNEGIYVSSTAIRGLLPGLPNPTTNRQPIRVLIVDDNPVERMAISAFCEAGGDIVIVGEAEDGLRGIEIAELLDPDVILMDLQMPTLDGVGATRRILSRQTDARILITTSLEVGERVLAAINAGAIGYQNKANPKYREAIRRAHKGDTVFPPEVEEELKAAELRADGALTPRQIDTARLVAKGFSNREIASSLGISSVTVRTHLTRTFDRLGLSNRVQLALYAIRAGWAGLD